MAISKTSNFQLQKPGKGTKNWDGPINENADIIDTELGFNRSEHKRLDQRATEIEGRINNIVGQSGSSNTEIVDARKSTLSGTTHSVLKDRIAEAETYLMPYSSYSSDPDVNGIYTKVEYKRADASLHLRVISSNPDEFQNYRTMTFTYYDKTGVQIVKTQVWTLGYDVSGNIISKVVS